MTCFDLYPESKSLACVVERTQQVVTMKNKIKTGNVVLKATVTGIGPVRGQHPHHRWLITFKVDTVVAGDFSGPVFSMNIHSPEKSGIVVGGKYVIELSKIRTDEYALKTIDPYREKDATE